MITSVTPLTCVACSSGERRIRGIGSVHPARRPVRYKKPAWPHRLGRCRLLPHRCQNPPGLRHAEPAAWSLYLVLVTVADAQGLSYYSDATLSRLLKLDPRQLAQARQQLVAADLVAYQKPLYQVLALPVAALASVPAGVRQGQPLSVGDLLRRALEGGAS